VGILTNRDLRFETNLDHTVSSVMTRENLITVSSDINLEDSKKILHEHRIEKLLVVDEKYNLKGLITIKDIEKIKKYPNACKDSLGRLRVGAAVGIIDREERVDALLKAGVDVVVIDTSHGHSAGVIDAVRNTKSNFPDCELIAGNVDDQRGGGSADKGRSGCGKDRSRVPVPSCTTRIVAGVGVPQITAIRNCFEASESMAYH